MQNSAGRLDPEFVRGTYDSMLSGMPTSYAFHRWGKDAVARAHYTQTRRALERVLRPSYGPALEVGGGDGVWTELIAPRAGQIDFVDISEEMLERARIRLAAYPHISFTHADFLAYVPQRGAYALALSVRNLEYMPDKSAALAKYADALRSGGQLVIVTKNPEFRRVGSVSGKTLHTGQVPVDELVSLLSRAGFHSVHLYPAIIGVGLKYAPLRLLWSASQILLLRLPQALMPRPLLALFCESVLIDATRA